LSKVPGAETLVVQYREPRSLKAGITWGRRATCPFSMEEARTVTRRFPEPLNHEEEGRYKWHPE
jgi:hypothetical protein